MSKLLGRTLHRWATKHYAYRVNKRTAKRRENREWRRLARAK